MTPSPKPLKALVGAREIAIMAGVPERTIRRWASAGILPKPALKLRRKRLWTRTNIEKWLEQRRE